MKVVRLAIAGIVGVAVVVALAVSLLGGGDDSGDLPPIAPDGAPVGYTATELGDQAADLPHAAYWVGAREGVERYELTLTPQGRVFVRYLTGDAAVGDQSAGFLTVGSYPLDNAADALESGAETGGQRLTREDGFETLTGGKEGNAYVVLDDEPDVQVEVYSATPGEADDLVSSGAVEALD